MTPSWRGVAASVLMVIGAIVVLAGAYRPVELSASVGIAVAAGIAALTALLIGVAVLHPWRGLLLLLGAMPIVDVARAQIWIGPWQVLPITLLILSLAVGIAFDRWPRPRGSQRDPAMWTWLLLAVGAVLAIAATIAAPGSDEALNITLHGVLEPMAAFALVLALRPTAERALQAVLAVAAGVALATLVNLAWLVLLVGPRGLYEQRMLLARLTYFNVGIYAAMLVVALSAAAAAIFLRARFSRPGLVRATAVLAIGLMVVALFFTYTKSAWLSAALVAGLLIVLLVDGWRRRIPMLAAVAVLLALVVPYPLPLLRGVAPGVAYAYEGFLVALQGEARVESWDPDTYQGSGSVSIRLEAVGAAAEITAEAPLLGVGPGGFQQAFARIRPDASVPELQSAHNLLPNLAAEFGLPFAVLVSVGLLWTIGRMLLLGRTHEPLVRVLGTVLGVSLVGFLAMATLFGVDLYRTYRTMNLDVVTVAALAGLATSLPGRRSTSRSTARGEGDDPVEQPSDLVAPDQAEVGRSGA